MTQTAAAANLGPAIAMIDATIREDLGQLRLLRQTLGNYALADSASDLTHRFIVGAGAHTDVDSLMSLWDDHLGHWTRYQAVAIRDIDSTLRWTPALIHARLFTKHLLDHYFRHTRYDSDGGVLTNEAHRLTFNPRSVPAGFAYTLGLAYSTTLTAVVLAQYADADLDDRLDAYRAQAAREAVIPS